MREFDLIARIRARAKDGAGVALGIGDDAAVLNVVAGEQWVVCTDTLVSGVHFPQETAPADIGYKTLAVNLSDLAAMGASPRFATLALTLPQVDSAFVEPLINALIELGEAHGLTLVGGDTTRGPLSLTLTAIGSLPRDSALRRDAAQAGDAIYVSGTLGDAAAGLARLAQPAPLSAGDQQAADYLYQRLARPTPRVALGLALRGIAHACIDVSDGLSADLRHICDASGLGAQIDADNLPTSEALRALVPDQAARWRHQQSGDDYELCFTVAAEQESRLADIARSTGVALTRIGTMVAGSRVQWVDGHGHLQMSADHGYQHFA